MTSEPGSVIVTGIPGSGKTTVAHALASRAKLAAHLEVDAIYEFIVAGRIQFAKDSGPDDWWQLKLARSHVQMLAMSFAEQCVLPFVDDVVADRGVLDDYLRGLPRPVRLIVLDPTVEAVLARDAARHKQVASGWAYLAQSMREALSGIGLWLDTSELDVDMTVLEIERRWDAALLAQGSG